MNVCSHDLNPNYSMNNNISPPAENEEGTKRIKWPPMASRQDAEHRNCNVVVAMIHAKIGHKEFLIGSPTN